MYHCHVNFYLLGQQSGFLEKIKEMPPMEHFTHEYMESPEPEQSLAAKADVVLYRDKGYMEFPDVGGGISVSFFKVAADLQDE